MKILGFLKRIGPRWLRSKAHDINEIIWERAAGFSAQHLPNAQFHIREIQNKAEHTNIFCPQAEPYGLKWRAK